MLRPPLPRSFYDRDALQLARDLLGKSVVHGDVVLRITETEAYLPDDSACHAYRGKTPRNAPMFGPCGHSYVYLCYGMHMMFNVVADAPGVPAAVLVRGALPLEGIDLVYERRRGRLDLDGPGKVGQALGINRDHSGLRLDGELRISDGEGLPFRQDKRVGIDYARPEHRDAPWRFIAVPTEP